MVFFKFRQRMETQLFQVSGQVTGLSNIGRRDCNGKVQSIGVTLDWNDEFEFFQMENVEFLKSLTDSLKDRTNITFNYCFGQNSKKIIAFFYNISFHFFCCCGNTFLLHFKYEQN